MRKADLSGLFSISQASIRTIDQDNAQSHPLEEEAPHVLYDPLGDK